MSQMTYVCLYLDYIHTLEALPEAARGKLVVAMLRYAATGEDTVFTGPGRYVWPMFREQILRDQTKYREKCEKNRRNGAKGGRPAKKTTETDRLQTGAKEKENEKVNEKTRENEKIKENEKENERENEMMKENERESEIDMEIDDLLPLAPSLSRLKL